jgi:hypothetical protein
MLAWQRIEPPAPPFNPADNRLQRSALAGEAAKSVQANPARECLWCCSYFPVAPTASKFRMAAHRSGIHLLSPRKLTEFRMIESLYSYPF